MTVQDVMMVAVDRLRPEDGLIAALERLRSAEVRCLPVVDDRGVLKGVLTDRDLQGVRRGIHTVGEVMEKDAWFTFPDADVRAAARRMAERGAAALPVVDARGRVLGVVSAVALLRAVLDSPEPIAKAG